MCSKTAMPSGIKVYLLEQHHVDGVSGELKADFTVFKAFIPRRLPMCRFVKQRQCAEAPEGAFPQYLN